MSREKKDMGLIKHGDGNLLPENESQKIAAQQGGSMSEEDREALRKENDAADGSGSDG